MRKKDILKTIKSDIEENTPNIINKINIDDIEIKPAINNNKESRFNSFKVIKIGLSFGILIIAIIGIYSLIYRNNPGPVNNLSVTAKDEIVATYVITGINVVASNNNNLLKLNNNSNIDVDYINEFKNYFYLIEDYFEMNENSITITYNDDNEYKYKMNVVTTNVFGKEDEYILYYDEKREVDDDEEEKKMNGILVHNMITYQFRSEEELEKDKSEIKVIIYKDNYYNRIEIEKEIENNEYQYEYAIFNNDNEVLTIELEVEDDEIKLEIESINNDYEYIITKLSETDFKIKYDDEIKFYLYIDLLNEKYIYSFDEEKSINNLYEKSNKF